MARPKVIKCSECDGDGFIVIWKRRGLIKVMAGKRKCWMCNGTGSITVRR